MGTNTKTEGKRLSKPGKPKGKRLEKHAKTEGERLWIVVGLFNLAGYLAELSRGRAQ